MGKSKKRKEIFFVLEYKEAPGHYYQGVGRLSIPNALKAKRYDSSELALNDCSSDDFEVKKIIVEVTIV